ncbi:MAG: dTDP-4-dehydrorhamnose reductase [Candidatus Micrarchaeota archaeon]
MKVLIIGGTGLLGNNLLELAKGKFEVSATYRNHAIRGPDSYKLEVTDADAVKKLIDELEPGAVVNTTAFHNVDKCETERDMANAVNVDAAVNISNVCADVGAHHIYVSTEYVFDGNKGAAYVEDDLPNPLGYYGETKLMAEKAIMGGEGDNLIARTSVIYGLNETKLNFATWVISELENGRRIRIIDDQVGSPTLAGNLAEVLLKCIELRKTGMYHIAGGEAIDRYRFTLELADVFGFDKSLITPVNTSEFGQKARRPLFAPLDVGRIEEELEVKMLRAKEGLERMNERR